MTEAKSFRKDSFKYARKLCDICDDNKQCNQQIKSSHDRNDNIQNFYSCIFSKYDNCGKYYKNNCSVNRWNVKSIFKSRGHRITYYLTDTAPAYKTGNSKEYGKKNVAFFLTRFFFKISMNVVSRSASISAIKWVFFFINLR